MQTVNRGWLKRQVAAGKMEAANDHSYDEMTGQKDGGDWFPAVLKAQGEPSKPGQISFTDWEFRTKSGTAYRNSDGTITLIIHSNQSYKLRVKNDAAKV